MRTVGRVSVTHSLIPWRNPHGFLKMAYYLVGDWSLGKTSPSLLKVERVSLF